MRILQDTNILLRTSRTADPHYGVVTQAVTEVTQAGLELCICSQNLFEFWVVATRPEAANGFGLTPLKARAEIDLRRSIYTHVSDPPGLLDTWLDLCEQHGVSGVKAHDARLVALMLECGISDLLTLNAADFARFPGIRALTPQDILDGALSARTDTNEPPHD